MFALLLTPKQLATIQNALFFSSIDATNNVEFRLCCEEASAAVQEQCDMYVSESDVDMVQVILENIHRPSVAKQFGAVVLWDDME